MSKSGVVGIVVARIVAAEVGGNQLAGGRMDCPPESFKLASL